jgi:ribosomal protein S18 acetylase RimI-like enzyme
MTDLKIHPLEDEMKDRAVRFIDSWNADDVYDRFGTAGIDGREWLAAELQRGRSSLVAEYEGNVVGLLDYTYAQGAIHIGIVVDRRFRRRSIGKNLVRALLASKGPERPVAAECRVDNRPAVALLRGCCFDLIGIEKPEMIWRAA